MSDVQFEDSRNNFNNNNSEPGSKMINFLIKKGIVKSQGQAVNVLIAIAVVFLLVAGYFFYYTYSITNLDPNDPSFKLTEEEISALPPEAQEIIRSNQNK